MIARSETLLWKDSSQKYPQGLLALAKCIYSGLCSSRARWPLAPNFCPRATRKSQIFHTNHMLGTLDFTDSEDWAPFNFPESTALILKVDIIFAEYAGDT